MQKTLEKEHKGFPTNTNETKGQACFFPILDRLYTHFEDMTNKHCKVMQVRFDLRYPADGSITPNKQHLHDFNYNLQRKLNREKHAGGHKADPRLIMVTEQHHSNHPHMHGVLLGNANAKQSYRVIVAQTEQIWQQALGTDAKGLVDRCDRQGSNGLIIKRGNKDFQDKKNQCFHQASYLAKERGKENNDKGSWVVSGTHTPKKPKE